MTSPQNIIITGASAGIGKSLALAYAKKGITLGLIARSQDKLTTVAELCRQNGANVQIGVIDITDDVQLKEWLLAFDAQNPVDLIIANAGITSSIINGEAENWKKVKQVLDINIYGVFNTVHPLILPMQLRKHGQIAIISSVAAYCGMPISPTYSATKAAIKNYAEGLRGWLKEDEVTVSVICPGFVKTELSDNFHCPKLFMISSETAAQYIQQGLAKNKAEISFPVPINWIMKLLGLLPTDLSNWLFQLSGYGTKRKNK